MKLFAILFSLLFFGTVYSQLTDTVYSNGKVIIRSNILVTMDSGELKARQNAPSPLATSVGQNNLSQGRQANLCGVVSSFTPNRDTSFSTAFAQTFTSTSTNTTSVQWLLNGIPYSIQPSVNVGFTAVGLHEIKLIAKNGACTDTSIVYYLYTGVPPTAPRTTMLNNYGLPSMEEYSTCMDHVPNGGFILGGYTYRLTGGPGDQGLVMKISETGCIEWSKLFQDTAGRVAGVKTLRDSGCIVALISPSFQEGTLLRYDKNGQLIWKQNYAYNGTGILFKRLYETADGSIIATASDPSFDGFYISKLSAAGAVMWCKSYLKSIDDFSTPVGIAEIGNRLFISGYLINPNQEVQYNSEYNNDGFILKLDQATGNTIWSKAFGSIGYSDFFQQIYPYGNNLLVNGIRTNYLGAGNARQTYHFIDTLGVVLKSRAVSIPETLTFPFLCNVLPLANKKLYLTRGAYQTLPLQPGYVYNSYWEKIDTSDNIYWRSKAGSISGHRFWYSAVGNNETIATLGEHSNSLVKVNDISNNFLFTRIDTSGPNATNCIFYQSANTIIPDPNPIVTMPLVWIRDININLLASNSTTVPNKAYTQMRYQCPDYVDSCSYVKISGEKRLCNLAQTYTYHASKNNGCGMPVDWQVPPGVQTVTQTATDITVRFPGFGQYTIAAVVNYSCNPVADSIRVTVTSSSASLNLGADTTLCIGNTIKLHAGTRFITYKWQDNSTDSTLMVSSPGLYWITVSDSCGNILSDTISVQFTAAILIDIGADRTKCNNDTLHLSAPPGFLNYTWSNNYNISSTIAPNVTINPLVDTAYYIKAEKTPGCFAYDTVRIMVYQSPPINLGPDKSFCSGDSAIFNAGNGFQSYLWSTSAITQRITAKAVGTYAVVATTVNGCKSFDTVKVLSVYPLPVVHLDKDSAICIGSFKTLDAGNFSTYLWSTGSTAKTIIVNSIGLYSVTVSDANGCKGSDTTKITMIRLLPVGFLPADTNVCSYGKIELKPLALYNSYVWNTGATTSSIMITQPGIYFLKVTDVYTCVGTDSIIVAPKDCLKGFYIPTAFTPDGNGQNDIFRPMLFGSVKSYAFTVFNRWGQVVFTTTETGKGWNGKVAGTTQPTGVFAWACTYQFEGEPVKQEKGTVVVIH